MDENYETMETKNQMNHDMNAWMRIMKLWKLRIKNQKFWMRIMKLWKLKFK